MDDCLVRLNSRWTQGLRALRDKFNEFHKLIDGYGVSTTICTEFFNLYISGVPSNALDQFLNTSLNIGVASRLFKAIENCCVEIEHNCMCHFIRPGENILYLLGELQAVARWPERFKRIGLNEKAVRDLISLAKHLILSAEKFITQIRDARANFSAFCQWLVPTIIDVQSNSQEILANMNKEKLHQINRMRQSVLEHENALRLSALLDPTTSRDGEKDVSLDKILHSHINKHFDTVVRDKSTVANDSESKTEQNNSSYMLSYEHILNLNSVREGTFARSSAMKQCGDGLKSILVDLKERWQKAFHHTSETLSSVFKPIANAPIYTQIASNARNNDEKKDSEVDPGFPRTPACKFAFHSQSLPSTHENEEGMDHMTAFTGSTAANKNNVIWILKYNTYVHFRYFTCRITQFPNCLFFQVRCKKS